MKVNFNILTERLNSIFNFNEIKYVYHFTPLKYLDKILKDNALLPAGGTNNSLSEDKIIQLRKKYNITPDKDNTYKDYVSFTTDENYNIQNGNAYAKLTLDYNKLSEDYTIEDYKYHDNPMESEKRIKGAVKNLDKYLINIERNNNMLV